MQAHGGLLLGALFAMLIGAGLSLRSAKVRAALAAAFFRLPKLADYQRLFGLTGFYRTLGLLLAGGMSVVTSLELAGTARPVAGGAGAGARGYPRGQAAVGHAARR